MATKNAMGIKAVLFDLDDTLWPIAPTIRRAEIILHEWLAQHAPRVVETHSMDSLRARRMALIETNPQYRHDLWTLRHTVLREALEACGDDPAKADAAMAIFSRERNVVTLYDDVLPGLQNLAPRFLLGSISNGFADLQAIGLEQHFRVSIAAHKLGFAKPEARIFHLACEALKVAPHEAVYVGDDLSLDVEGAQQAGLRAVWINRFEREAPDSVQPDLVCTDLHGLAQWLDEAGNWNKIAFD
jgi:putative hydrolase of the HAD superfamily